MSVCFNVTTGCDTCDDEKRETCGILPILRLLAEAKEVTEVGQNFRDTNGGEEEGMWFWVRR